MANKRIVIADAHEVVRSGLRLLLEAQNGWEVVGEAANGKEALALIEKHVPEVAIIDYMLPFENGIEVTRRIKAGQIPTEVLLFTMHNSDVLIKEAFKAGAKAFLLKSEAYQELLTAIEALLMHQPYISGPASELMLASYLASQEAPVEVLTTRERMVVQLVAEGHSNREMGKILNLSIKTIETHRASAMRKLSVKSTAGLVRYAVKNLLVQ
jgi:DNA-binding NarL/FixJ family response regulator